MDRLFDTHHKLLQNTSTGFVRNIEDDIRWNNRMIGITGARGIGKTTLFLQHIKKLFHKDNSALYVSLDNLWFADNTLVYLAEKFAKQGGTHLFLDEVHKYSGMVAGVKKHI